MFSPRFSLRKTEKGLFLGFGTGFRILNATAALFLLATAFTSWPPFWLPAVLGLLAAAGAGYREGWTFTADGAVFKTGWGPWVQSRLWTASRIDEIELSVPPTDRVKGAPAFVYRLVMNTDNLPAGTPPVLGEPWEGGPVVLEIQRGERGGEELAAWGKSIAGTLGKPFSTRT